jgi:TRAP-type transport system small permease protein
MTRINLVHKIINMGAFISLAAMIVVVTIQVFSRYFMESTPHWTEEAARMFFIYAVAFGTGIGIRNGDFIMLNLIGKYLSPRKDRVLQLSTHVLTIAFSLVLIFSSLRFVRLGMDEQSPALEITMGFVFFSMVIIGLAIAIFTLEHLFILIKGIKQ